MFYRAGVKMYIDLAAIDSLCKESPRFFCFFLIWLFPAQDYVPYEMDPLLNLQCQRTEEVQLF